MESIEEKLRAFVVESIMFGNNGYPYSDEASFLESGIVDSMSVMELVMYAEKNFSISVNDSEIVPANFDSIRNLSGFIRRKMNKAP